ncbi:MAG: hypothetical protein ACREQ9_27030, partial [Candidatus Binatia bacterium]
TLDVGRMKVVALSEALSRIAAPSSRIVPVAHSIDSLRGLVEAKQRDLLVSCVDDDAARLAASIIATLYARPLLDVGTGVFGRGARRRKGADIRLVVPGDRCLLCLGGLADVETARVAVAGRASIDSTRPWYLGRAGSLRSLNQVAAHCGLGLVEDLVAEIRSASAWLRLEFDTAGMPSFVEVRPPRVAECRLCAHAGRGDDALGEIRALLAVPGLGTPRNPIGPGCSFRSGR